MRLILLLVPAVLASALLAQTPAAQERIIAFEQISLVPMDRERVVARQTVIVRGDRITEIGESGRVSVPAGATRVDGSGQYLIPALAEMHAHVPAGQAAGEAERVLFMYVANGIGTIRSMLGDPAHFTLRDRSR